MNILYQVEHLEQRVAALESICGGGCIPTAAQVEAAQSKVDDKDYEVKKVSYYNERKGKFELRDVAYSKKQSTPDDKKPVTVVLNEQGYGYDKDGKVIAYRNPNADKGESVTVPFKPSTPSFDYANAIGVLKQLEKLELYRHGESMDRYDNIKIIGKMIARYEKLQDDCQIRTLAKVGRCKRR